MVVVVVCSIEPVRCGDGRGSISVCLGVGWEGCSHHTKERVNVHITPRVHGAPFFVHSNLYFFRCEARRFWRQGHKTHMSPLWAYMLHPHERMHACMHAYSAVHTTGAWWHQP